MEDYSHTKHTSMYFTVPATVHVVEVAVVYMVAQVVITHITADVTTSLLLVYRYVYSTQVHLHLGVTIHVHVYYAEGTH